MNEEQRLDSQKVVTTNSSDKKSAKDYSKYFETVYTAPSLKEAKKRGKDDVHYQSLKGWVRGVNSTCGPMGVK